ncbi:hypothetical protein CVU82_01820 [Candidatus Falkowbacteria bacterium HGW-Falkowbacteria-1]|uniref:Lipoprotein n=1 Tax=Candidatus Falkowbacteria bacterium HGW-Falkowbacteria-1 TaxID=2013768 RepID=A0A2N2E9B9_9BACT|nr:MAG: hypothetical protein CVU82_01820 [Candidatus Falkowbacteria bacterium HGW-Falkowbacteria-1]
MKISKFYFFVLFLFLIFSFSACGKKDLSDQNQNGKNEEKQLGANVSNEESYFSKSVEDLFAEGKPLQCSATVESGEGSVVMNYYFDNNGKKLRVESQTLNKASNLNINSVSILDDNWYYFWDDLTNKDGMKMKVEENQENVKDKNIDENNNFDMKEEFDFKCKSWKVDSSMFDLPKDKTFKDLTSLMNGFGTNAPTINNEQSGTAPSFGNGNSVDACSYCNMLPAGSDRDECLDACS